MNEPSGLPEAYDYQRRAEPQPVTNASADRGGLLSSLSFSFGRRLKFKMKFEVRRSEFASTIDADNVTAGAQVRHRLSGEIRNRIRRVLSPDTGRQVPHLGSENPPWLVQPPVSRPEPFRAVHSASVNFWGALHPAEREAFLGVAAERTFARGARLVREGESADHVIVILHGWTKICVDERGRERILAERGPGQLIGERGALQVNVRSASVVALDRVDALVASTEDFAAFISAHPRALAIIEDQVYERLTEKPATSGRDSCSIRAATLDKKHVAEHAHSSLSAELSGQPTIMLTGQNCTIILTDVVAFGSRTRSDIDRRVIREAILDMTQEALRELGDVWSWEGRGDGLLIIVSPSVPTAKVIDHLLAVLPDALYRHNVSCRESARIKLRVSVNVGPISSDRMGLSGEAIIVAARMLDAPAFKEAMAKSGANLGIITSSWVYESIIRHSQDQDELTGYSQVQVDVKESHIEAWIKLIDKTTSPHDIPYAEVLERYLGLLTSCGQPVSQTGAGRGIVDRYYPRAGNTIHDTFAAASMTMWHGSARIGWKDPVPPGHPAQAGRVPGRMAQHSCRAPPVRPTSPSSIRRTVVYPGPLGPSGP